jgi:glycosyltransferase involved in cell wall biosynthesis
MFHVIVNCGFCEKEIGRCIDSLKMQTLDDWRAWVNVDRKGDGTYGNAIAAAAGDSRFDIVQNERREYPMANILRTVARSDAAAEDVIVIVDGDDWLITPNAFSLIASAYARDNCWLTYGSWISDDPRSPGRWPPYEEGTTDFRSAPWLGTAVRSWKRWLFDRIDNADFCDATGRYLRLTEDMACMFPMLEMATTRRARHIAEPLLFYNRSSSHDAGRALADEGRANTLYLRNRRPYASLSDTPNVHSQIDADSRLASRDVP